MGLLRVFVRIKIRFNRVILSKTRGNSELTESYPLLFRSLNEPWRKTTKLATEWLQQGNKKDPFFYRGSNAEMIFISMFLRTEGVLLELSS